MAKRIVFRDKGDVRLEEFTVDAVDGNKVLFQTEYSLVSTGTETIALNSDFSPGTLWDDWVKYPFYPGYACVGVVEEVGPQAQGVVKGTRAALRYQHGSVHTPPAADLLPIPEGVDPRAAAWFALAKITSMGARAAHYRLGDSVCIVGAGPIGQMSARWAHACGVEHIVVCDRAAPRLSIALQGGATHVFDKPAHEVKEDLKRACDGTLPRVVIDTTGHAAAFASALALVADRGTLVLLGDTGHPEAQHLTFDVVTRGVTIVGAHDTHEDPVWNERSIARLWFNLVKTGRFRIDGLNTHVFRPEQCAEAYATANKSRETTMGMLFAWS
jgi:2-desacetyl-2-hydroxyethyl bacteriochlorophyllide A dehydrogenase